MQHKQVGRRIVALHWVLLGLVALTLAGCGNTTPAEQIIGKWKFTKVITAGETKLVEESGFELSLVYEFFKDGSMTYIMRSDGQEIRGKGTYTLQANGQLTMTERNNKPSAQDVEFKGDTMIFTTVRSVETNNSFTASDSGNGQQSDSQVMVLERVD